MTGGCGYKGHVLVPKVLHRGYEVIVLDTQWFGNFLEPHKNLSIIKGDVRDTDAIPLQGIDGIIHLSSIANDPCGDLDPKLTWEVSALATMQLADKAERNCHGKGRVVVAGAPLAEKYCCWYVVAILNAHNP